MKRKTKYVKTCRCIVRYSKYRSFNLRIDANQKQLDEYVERMTGFDGAIRKLVNEKKELQIQMKVLMDDFDGGSTQQTFLQKLIHLQSLQSDEKQKSKSIRYDDEIKKIGIFYYLMGGRNLYQILSKNLPLPSLSTVRRHLYELPAPVEGSFCFSEFEAFNNIHGGSQYVWVAEDDTKVCEGLAYNKYCDTIVGLVLPIDKNTGAPVINFYKFSSIELVNNFITKSQLSSFVKLLVVCPLAKGAKPYILSLYGTRGSDNSEDTEKRWLYIRESFRRLGITVVGKFLFGFCHV